MSAGAASAEKEKHGSRKAEVLLLFLPLADALWLLAPRVLCASAFLLVSRSSP